METPCIDLVGIKTEEENHQREDTKRGLMYDRTLPHNLPKELKSENEKEHTVNTRWK